MLHRTQQLGIDPASRAKACASSRSSFFRLSPISRTLRAWATITSCPNSLRSRLIQGECVPVSNAIRLRGMAPKTSCNTFAVVRTRYSSCIRPAIQHTRPGVAIAQIESDGQLLLRNIPALLRRCGANLLHCRSPFYLCLEHVDNLGAYTASRPETGLLISSDYFIMRPCRFVHLDN